MALPTFWRGHTEEFGSLEGQVRQPCWWDIFAAQSTCFLIDVYNLRPSVYHENVVCDGLSAVLRRTKLTAHC